MKRALIFIAAGLLALPTLDAGRRDRSKKGGKRSSRSSKSKSDEKYVSVPKARLKSDKRASATTVSEILRGTKLKVLNKGDGRWMQVAIADKPNVTGWIYFNKLVDEKPKDVKNHLAFGGGIQTSDLETGGAIRGLKKVSANYASEKGISKRAISDLNAIQTFPFSVKTFDKNKNGNLETTEQKTANTAYKKWLNSEIDNFLKTGKVGEFAN
jgi:hypothetical protein